MAQQHHAHGFIRFLAWPGGMQAGVIHMEHTSWDNNYACDLIELGVIGFLLR